MKKFLIRAYKKIELKPGFTIRLGFTDRSFPVFIKKGEDLDKAYLRIIKPGEKAVFPIQIHQKSIKIVDQKILTDTRRFWVKFPNTDGLITKLSRTRLMIVTADCVPLFVIAPSRDPWIGVIHAGWRGLNKRIALEAVRKLARLSQMDPSMFKVVIGPALRAPCYEVGPEFRKRFKESVYKKNGRLVFDIVKETIIQLSKARVKRSNIVDSGMCTFCSNKRFYSYRREGVKAGRMVSWIVKDKKENTK